jgi:FkbM family methyltransferase
MTPATDLMAVAMTGGVAVFVPATLGAITTYVLLEQEDWFEPEIHFVRKLVTPGMRALDIGANYGVYATTLAALTGSSGRVFAFEPARSVAAALRRSAIHNRLPWLQVVGLAVSDRNGVAMLGGKASELMSLSTMSPGSDPAQGEAVETVTLDSWAQQNDPGPVDFVKIDAEGAEAPIVAGGRDFFASRSPLVMLEVRRDATFDFRALDALRALGYAPYRLMPGLGLLAPLGTSIAPESLDPFLLNLFCCKPETAAALAARGLLAHDQAADEPAPERAERFLAGMPYDAGFGSLIRPAMNPGNDEYERGLAFYATSRHGAATPSARLAALRAAYESFQSALTLWPSFVRLLSTARAAADLGERRAAVAHLQAAVRAISRPGFALDEHFLAPSQRFEQLIPAPSEGGQWLVSAITETLEKLAAFSGAFLAMENVDHLQMLSEGSFGCAEMERRRQLALLRRGKIPTPQPTPLLIRGRPDCLNPHLWDSRRRQTWIAQAA